MKSVTPVTNLSDKNISEKTKIEWLEEEIKKHKNGNATLRNILT